MLDIRENNVYDIELELQLTEVPIAAGEGYPGPGQTDVQGISATCSVPQPLTSTCHDQQEEAIKNNYGHYLWPKRRTCLAPALLSWYHRQSSEPPGVMGHLRIAMIIQHLTEPATPSCSVLWQS